MRAHWGLLLVAMLSGCPSNEDLGSGAPTVDSGQPFTDAGPSDAGDPYAGWDPSKLHIDTISPNPLVLGQTATITGEGFIRDATRVNVWFTTGTVHPDSASPTQLLVTVPTTLEGGYAVIRVLISHAQSNQMIVPYVSSTENDGGQTQTGDAGSTFYVSSVSPASATPNSMVTVNGRGFGTGLKAFFGSTQAATGVPTSYSVDIRVPTGFPTGSTTIHMELDGGSTNSVPFTVLQ